MKDKMLKLFEPNNKYIDGYKENIKPSCVPSYNYFVINENNDFIGIIYYCL